GPVAAAAAAVGLGVTWIAGATVALRYALALPLIEPLLASLAALGATMGYRFVIAGKGKRLLRPAVAPYPPPALIEKKLPPHKQPHRAGRRDTQRPRLFLRPRRLPRDRGENPADRIGGGDERISLGDDRRDRGAWRLRRQVFRRRHRGGVRGAARRSASRHERGARGAAVRCLPRHARSRERRIRRHGAPAHRAQLRRGAGRQYRLAAALPIQGDGRTGEPRFAA